MRWIFSQGRPPLFSTAGKSRFVVALACLFLAGMAVEAAGQEKSAEVLAMEARRAGDEIARKYEAENTPDAHEKMAAAFFERLDKGFRSVSLFDANMAFIDEIDRRFGKEDSLAIRVKLIEALVRSASQLVYRPEGLQWQDNIAPALAIFDGIDRRFGQDPRPEIREQITKALIIKGRIIKDYAEIAVYNDIDRRFGEDDHPAVRAQAIEALFKKSAFWFGKSNDSKGLAVVDEINRRFGQDPKIRQRLVQELANRKLYERIEQRFGKDADADVQSAIATALYRKKEDDPKAAQILYDEIVRRFGENPKAQTTIFYSLSLRMRLEDVPASIATYNEMDRRFGEKGRSEAASNLANKVKRLFEQGNSKDALALHAELERRFKTDPAIRGSVIAALFFKANFLCQQGETKIGMAVFDEILQRFGAVPDVKPRVANAILDNGKLLQKQGQLKAALTFYEGIEQRFGKDENRGYQLVLAEMLLWKGETLVRQGNLKAAIAVYDRIDSRFGGFKKESKLGPALALLAPAIGKVENDSYFQQQVAKALYNKAILLGTQDNRAAELALYDEILQRVSVGGKGYIFVPGAELAAQVRLNKAALLEQQGEFRAAITLYDEIIDSQLGNAPHRALLQKGVALELLGDTQAAQEIFAEYSRYFGRRGQSVEERLAQGKLLELSGQSKLNAALAIYDALERDYDGKVPQALFRKAQGLERQGKRQEAIKIYTEIDQRFGGHMSPATREVVQRAAAARAVASARKS
ncbi:MAG: tetratricopeptide repeat protein [Zoogloeaceae bacterium]|nr:tetratricopeptide repeat protein [Zoogloeaceae bacterium]